MGLINDDELKQVLVLIHPAAFDERYVPGMARIFFIYLKKTNLCLTYIGTTQKGLTEIDVAEGVKIQLCNILEHICDIQQRHRVESLISFAEGFVNELQQDQCRRSVTVFIYCIDLFIFIF